MSQRPLLFGLPGLVKEFRDAAGITQEQLAASIDPPSSRTSISLLEQGLRLPSIATIAAICTYLRIPDPLWKASATENGRLRVVFESAMSELTGGRVALRSIDPGTIEAVEQHISKLLSEPTTNRHLLDRLNTALVFYGIPFIASQFFERYLGVEAFRSEDRLFAAIARFQQDAIRLHPTLAEAYDIFNSVASLADHLRQLDPRPLSSYWERSEWLAVQDIPKEHLSDLGYISATRVKSENADRQEIATSLKALAAEIRIDGRAALLKLNERKKRRLDTLLRRLGSSLRHDISSPLFSLDPDALEREAALLAPTTTDLERIAQTHSVAYRNLCQYLSADYLDVYVATSMRTDADYVSVHEFVRKIFQHPDIRPLKLRYFNPTQSGIGDRLAKGLVEALMLRRSNVTIYMAQKDDTFGKDSEASVALGQGKPVIVFVPKLSSERMELDSAKLWSMSKSELIALLQTEDPETFDSEDQDSLDIEALASRLLSVRLSNAPTDVFIELIGSHWADFDLYGETDRISDDSRAEYRKFLDQCVRGQAREISPTIAAELRSVFVATAARFEKRAKTFLLIHPLALQVITRSRILNGILVVRDVHTCAVLLRSVLANTLEFDLVISEHNYQLVERVTKSTVRVIPRHELLKAAFERFYLLDSL
jgi:DNA-binding XRE family transcriptional regulator